MTKCHPPFSQQPASQQDGIWLDFVDLSALDSMEPDRVDRTPA